VAHQTVPLSNSHVHPIFQELFNNLMKHEILHVERILGSCCFDRCQAQADVCDIDTGMGYCRTHFREVHRG